MSINIVVAYNDQQTLLAIAYNGQEDQPTKH